MAIRPPLDPLLCRVINEQFKILQTIKINQKYTRKVVDKQLHELEGMYVGFMDQKLSHVSLEIEFLTDDQVIVEFNQNFRTSQRALSEL